jgi:hypothetical protein
MSSSIPAVVMSAPLQKVAEGAAFRLADLNDVVTARAVVGAALRRAIGIVGLTDKEAADLIGVDKSQLSRWLSGGESIQLHRIYRTKLHGPFAIEQARDASGCVVETTVTYAAVTR